MVFPSGKPAGPADRQGGRDITLPVNDPRWAWSEYRPDATRPWTLARVGHLYRRAGFGASWDELEQGLADGPRATISRLVQPPDSVAPFDATYDADEDAVARSGGIDSLRAWWLRRMIETPFALGEKMTLFWHAHFGVSHRRVNQAELMVRHIRTLRQNALGSYRQLLQDVARDPASLLAADASASRKARPNTHFIQQLMDQFSVGPGNYGAEDVREAARAMTGWFVLRGQLRFLEHEHDAGTKRILGQSGQWTREDVVRIVLDQPATPLALARRLYRGFISEVDDPSSELLDPLVNMLAENYDIGPVVERMLRSNLFFSSVAYRCRVKSPVEYAIGIVRAFGGRVPTTALSYALSQMGQRLYDPPTSRGWAGGASWLNAVTLLKRFQLAEQLLAPAGPFDGRLDIPGWLDRSGLHTQDAVRQRLLELLLQAGADVGDDDVPSSSGSRRPGADLAAGVRESALQIIRASSYQLA